MLCCFGTVKQKRLGNLSPAFVHSGLHIIKNLLGFARYQSCTTSISIHPNILSIRWTSAWLSWQKMAIIIFIASYCAMWLLSSLHLSWLWPRCISASAFWQSFPMDMYKQGTQKIAKRISDYACPPSPEECKKDLGPNELNLRSAKPDLLAQTSGSLCGYNVWVHAEDHRPLCW